MITCPYCGNGFTTTVCPNCGTGWGSPPSTIPFTPSTNYMQTLPNAKVSELKNLLDQLINYHGIYFEEEERLQIAIDIVKRILEANRERSGIHWYSSVNEHKEQK